MTLDSSCVHHVVQPDTRFIVRASNLTMFCFDSIPRVICTRELTQKNTTQTNNESPIIHRIICSLHCATWRRSKRFRRGGKFLYDS